ncbi:hypothetical protein TNCT_508681 [Trichonephila clavata]|uniref:Uncharacterized protein n=1 Tax=Trichonephila clavata TaxID=2740835 RepID=A0A8X6FVB0_TRICU|nr:hypothetical protein TNCT_508681 [Trichonephila clavata]
MFVPSMELLICHKRDDYRRRSFVYPAVALTSGMQQYNYFPSYFGDVWRGRHRIFIQVFCRKTSLKLCWAIKEPFSHFTSSLRALDPFRTQSYVFAFARNTPPHRRCMLHRLGDRPPLTIVQLDRLAGRVQAQGPIQRSPRHRSSAICDLHCMRRILIFYLLLWNKFS